MKLTWYGHSCFMLESSAGSVVFDPYAAGKVPGVEMPALTADMVLSSHKHSDHYCPEKVNISGTTPLFDICRISCFHDDAQGSKRGNNYISVVEAEGMRVAHMGDLGHELSPAQLEKLGKVDVLLIPVGGFYTVDAKQAAAVVEAVKPAVTIPMHYRSDSFGFDVIGPLEDFLAACPLPVERPDSPVIFDSVPEKPIIWAFKAPTQE